MSGWPPEVPVEPTSWPADELSRSTEPPESDEPPTLPIEPIAEAAGPPQPEMPPTVSSASASGEPPTLPIEPVPDERDHVEKDLPLLAGVTDRGLRHFRNEDAMAVAATQSGESPVAIAVVCDGVSSSGRPDEASQAAAKAALDVLVAAAEDRQDMAEASARAARAAQQAVIVLAGPPGSTPPADAPSATFVSSVITTAGVTVCWLGDSRAYWLDSTAPAQLTTDDSVAAALVSAGIMSEEEALASPNAHVVTGWLGAEDSGTTPHVCTFVPPGAGVVLICSDGLWNYQPDAAGLAERALPAALTSPLATARALVQFANDSGGHDNVTVVLVPFPPAGPRPVGPHDVTLQLTQ
jgi:serine/threonine protein phosphatase PrpC